MVMFSFSFLHYTLARLIISADFSLSDTSVTGNCTIVAVSTIYFKYFLIAHINLPTFSQ